jgi:hypothetical protein
MITAVKLPETMTILPTFTSQPEDTLKVCFKPMDVERQWIRCATIANFVAAYFQDVNADPALPPIIDTNLLSTVLNELIENAAKYSADRQQENVLIVYIFKNALYISITNVATQAQANKVAQQLNVDKNADELEEMYMNRLQEVAEDASVQRSAGLGLLMLQKDYPIQLKATINKEDSKYLLTVEVTWNIAY